MITIKNIEIKLLPAWMYETWPKIFTEQFKDIFDFSEEIEYNEEIFPYINIAIPLKEDCKAALEKYLKELKDPFSGFKILGGYAKYYSRMENYNIISGDMTYVENGKTKIVPVNIKIFGFNYVGVANAKMDIFIL